MGSEKPAPDEHHDLWTGVHDEDITKPDLRKEDVERELQERVFFIWSTPEFYGVSAYEPSELDCFIRDLEQEQSTDSSNLSENQGVGRC